LTTCQPKYHLCAAVREADVIGVSVLFFHQPTAIYSVDQARTPAYTQEWLNVFWLCVFPRLGATPGDGELSDAGEGIL
jgi:hypothetical protein